MKAVELIENGSIEEEGKKAMGIKEEAIGEAINLGTGKEHRVIDLANTVNELTGQTLRKLDHQTFKKV
ncbi:MAG: hypothetical protein H8D26_08295 [Methanomicrobia archaeon]|nr:hypothetical protein [Methanomicrobia archaeon]